MASKFKRRNLWWVKFRHPQTGVLHRESLETHDEVRAELIRARLELETALLHPRYASVTVPQRILSKLGRAVEASCEPAQPSVVPAPRPQAAVKRASVDEALRAYLNYIRTDNSPEHFANKVSMMRRFFGDAQVEAAGGPARTLAIAASKTEDGSAAVSFSGEFVDEITTPFVQKFIEGLGVSRKTMRHYRQFFHHFFETCMKLGLYHPANWHRPNPIAALPNYQTKNKRIVYLERDEITEQLNVLSPFPAIRMAAAIMIHAGLRRAETLWLTREAISPDYSFISVVNRHDEAADIESTLKTGERTVTILPPLRTELKAYLEKLDSRWLIPNGEGGRWRGDSFGKKLQSINQGASLKWTCLTFRHTFATQRAAEGWSLFRIAKEMGNSAAVVEQYYAGFIRPEGA